MLSKFTSFHVNIHSTWKKNSKRKKHVLFLSDRHYFFSSASIITGVNIWGINFLRSMLNKFPINNFNNQKGDMGERFTKERIVQIHVYMRINLFFYINTIPTISTKWQFLLEFWSRIAKASPLCSCLVESLYPDIGVSWCRTVIIRFVNSTINTTKKSVS